MSTIEMTDSNYKDLIDKSDLLFIDIWSQWCGPCKQSSPMFEKLAEEHANDKIIFAKLNAETENQASMHLKVSNLPTFFIFRNGNLVKRWSSGDVPRLRKEITEALSN
ncbi:MAG: thioredoxin family protein [Candidatus Heimdallarchaeota archaeon]|nr:thioredoxin family protein [Candidatus Heimdallarchaeota archaeon]MDH5645546.1 thioredoxin family protein [Candidatus Heimdallarchaeota archaeon]